MLLKRLFGLGLLLVAVSCSNNEPIIEKKEAAPAPDNEPELVEETEKETVKEFIDFPLPDEQIRIKLDMVPILREYLQSAKNMQKEIENMKLTPIYVDQDTLYLLEFSCQMDLCSYLLLDQSKGNQAFLMADLAKFVKTEQSPDYSKIFMQFDRKTASSLPLSNLAVIDLENWQPVTLENTMNDSIMLDYTWPILEAEWADNQTVSISIPNIMEAEKDLLKGWQQSGKNETKNVFLTTEDTID